MFVFILLLAVLIVGTSFSLKGTRRIGIVKRSHVSVHGSFGDDFDTSKKPSVEASTDIAKTDEIAVSGDTIVPIEDADSAATKEVVPEQQRKPEISSDMKDKLRRELESQGANPNVAGANPILIISGIVALLVIVGGQGFFY